MKIAVLFAGFLFHSLAGAFAPSLLLHHHGTTTTATSTTLHAEGKAPDYETRNVVLLKAEPVGEDESAILLHIDREEGDEVPFTYEPGHVLALEIQYNATRDTNVDNKTMADAQNNEMWMRGPYTVSSATPYTLTILSKTVGAKSRAFASAEPGTPLRVGGKFKVPIAKGISENTKRVVLISTGVGIGPCVGAIEQMLSNGADYTTIDLISSFRFPNQVIYKTYLEFWQEAYEGKFSFKPIVTDQVGRLSASDENMKLITESSVCSLTETHYHMIGNGQMVNEFKQGLLKAGVPKEKITLEVYFNHKEPVNPDAIERIATTIKAAELVNGASKQ